MWLTQLIPLFQLNGDYLKSEMFFGLAFFACFIGWRLYKKLHWSVGLSFTYLCFSTIYVFTNPIGPYQVEFGHGMTAHMLNAATSYIMLILCAMIVGLGRKEWVVGLTTAFSIGVLFNSAYVVIQWIGGNPSFYRGGLLCNASMNSSFIAACLPVFLGTRGKLYDPHGIRDATAFGLPLLAIWLSYSTMGIAVLGVVVTCWIILKAPHRSKYLVALIVVGLLVLIARPGEGQSFWEDSGRMKVLGAAFKEHFERITPVMGVLFGAGLGTMHFRLPWLVDQTGVLSSAPTHWYALHNDWAQLVIETGVVGLVLVTLVFAFALMRARGRPWLFAALAGYGMYALGNWPTHLFMPALFGALLLRLSFDEADQADRT